MKRKKILKVERLVVGQMQTNCYLIYNENTHEAIILDPGEDDAYIIEKVQQVDLKPLKIIVTHGHFDHILAAYSIQKTYNIPFVIHKNDRFLVHQMASCASHFLGFETHSLPPVIDEDIYDGVKVKIGYQYLDVIETPGHTPGSISLIDETRSFAIVGDLVFAGGGVGRTDFSYSNTHDLNRSIEIFLSYPKEMTIFTGHGETTTIGEVIKYHGKN